MGPMRLLYGKPGLSNLSQIVWIQWIPRQAGSALRTIYKASRFPTMSQRRTGQGCSFVLKRMGRVPSVDL